MIGKLIPFRPREAGEGDHAERGGGGWLALSKTTTAPTGALSRATSPACGGGQERSA
jgi:hypothetical protein